jgi:putative heme degradation protein
MISFVYSRIPQGQRASIEGTAFAGHPVLCSTILASFRVAGGRALIPLLPRWAVLFRAVKTFGRVVWFCRNRCAAIGTEGAYPDVLTTPCGQSACGGDGDLKFSFPSWARAFVTVEENAGDWSHGVEFLDSYGEVIHKVFLTSRSNLDAFCWWVEMNHAPNPAAGHARELRSPARLEGPAALCEGEVRFLTQDDFHRFLRGLIESEIPVRISVGNDGLVQTASITPNRLQEDGVSIYLGGEGTGLQLRKDRLAEVSLHRACSSSTWILKAYESEGFAACAIAPTRDEDAQQWQDLPAEIE